MAKFTEHFSGTVRTTKDAVRFGPLKLRRFDVIPNDDFGRNGDLVIVDNTADTSDDIAENRIPIDVSLCQKIPIVVTGGTFTITTASGVFPITIATVDDWVAAVNRAQIPGVRLVHDPRGSVTVNTVTSTWTDGTSDLPSALGIAGVQAGTFVVAVGTWECFPVGSTGIDVESSGVPVAPGDFTTFNFTGAGVSSIVDSGGGTVTITISGGGAGGVAYGVIAGDVGTATATAASELITFGGIGITVTATNAGAGLDTVSFDLDIADLPAGAGPLVDTDEIAVDDGGTTERHSIDDVVDAALPGVDVTTIDGQLVFTLVDTTRGNKVLSVAEQPLLFADNDLSDLEWMEIGDANNADSGYIMDFDGTVVFATGHCEDTGGNSKEIHLYIEGVDSATLGTLSGGADVSFSDNTLDVDFSQGDKIQCRAHDGSGGEIEDTVVKVTVKWRG